MHGSAASSDERSAPAPLAPALAEALVLGVEDDRVRVRLVTGPVHARGLRPAEAGAAPEPPAPPVFARVAVPGYAPVEGDRVLVQHVAETGAAFVTGVVFASRSASITTPSGASATAEGEVLALRDAGGRIVATLDGLTGELCLAAEGDLRLSAPSGRVLVEAAGEVVLRGASLHVNAEEARLAVGHWELRAERIVERTTDALRTVEGLLETRAKHARLLVSRTLEILSRRATIASEEDTRIDGKRVLLG